MAVFASLTAFVIFGIYLATIIDTGSRTAFLAFVLFLMLTVFHKRKEADCDEAIGRAVRPPGYCFHGLATMALCVLINQARFCVD